jgi:hypothetical protein
MSSCQIFLFFQEKGDICDNFLPCSNTEFSPQLRDILFMSIINPSCFNFQAVQDGVIVDSGASVCVSPHRSDFLSYKPSNMKIKDLSASNTVNGEGIVRWSFRDVNGFAVSVELHGYHLPSASVRLLSPQVLLQTIGGHTHQSLTGINISLLNGVNLIASYCQRSNLPIIPLLSQHETHCFWGHVFHSNNVSAGPSLLASHNTNLSASQKEVLLWHQRLSHASISWIQSLMRHKNNLLPCSNVKDHNLHRGPIIPTSSRAPSCDVTGLKCAACLLAKASTRSPSNLSPRHSPKEMKLKVGNLKPGCKISADHYFSPVQGRLPHTFGRERSGYTCGSLFVDHASGKIFNFPQYSNTASETIQSAMRLEAIARNDGFRIKSYHSDNGIFSSSDFKDHCNRFAITYTYSGVGAKHMNGIAERNIKTVAQLARANMLHLAHHWPQQADLKLWPQAVDYATWVFNNLPNMDSGLSPNELWTSMRADDTLLRRAHVFGCPVYVLDAALQDGKKIPKWAPRARLGLFLGFSNLHSSQVALVLNVETKKITPQYHVIFDDMFQTVHSLPPDKSIQDQWRQILRLERECFEDTDFDEKG